MIGRPKPPPLDAAARIRERARSRQAAAARAPEPVRALGIAEPGGPLVPLEIRRRPPGPREVAIDILFCGVCACDVDAGRGEPRAAGLPLVPGHSIVGVVSHTGAEAADLEPGTLVGVGALVDSCRECDYCRAGEEQFCAEAVRTYGARDPRTGEYTRGGYAKRIVVEKDFVLRIPAALDPAGAAPLLCAGARAYAALRRHGAGPGSTVGVFDPGAGGRLAAGIARAMGAAVTGMRDGEDPGAGTDRPDLVIDTRTPVFGGPVGAGSLVGSMAETRQLLEFCAEHRVACAVELVAAQDIGRAWDLVSAAREHDGFVLDLATLGGND